MEKGGGFKTMFAGTIGSVVVEFTQDTAARKILSLRTPSTPPKKNRRARTKVVAVVLLMVGGAKGHPPGAKKEKRRAVEPGASEGKGGRGGEEALGVTSGVWEGVRVGVGQGETVVDGEAPRDRVGVGVGVEVGVGEEVGEFVGVGVGVTEEGVDGVLEGEAPSVKEEV